MRLHLTESFLKAMTGRIKDYRQTWTIKPVGKEMIHVMLEGFIDPAGKVPRWIYNMLIIETPIKLIRSLRERMNK